MSLDYPMISVGFGNLVAKKRVVAVIAPDSLPIRKLKEDARTRGKLIDATAGKRNKSIVITDSEHLILSALSPATLLLRLHKELATESETEQPVDDES